MLSIIKKWLGLEDKTQTSSVVQPRTELATELVPNNLVETPAPVVEKAKKAAKPRKTTAAKTKTKTRKVKDN